MICLSLSQEQTTVISDTSALWVVQSTKGLRSLDSINKNDLIKGSEVSWLILLSQIVIRVIWS